MMTPERWQQIDQLYQAALDQKAADRSQFIRSACADDPELRREVESLLLAHEQAGSFIAEPALRSAAKLLARDQTGSLIGTTLAHYRIESILGAGGMGKVYLAQDQKLDRRVAIKILNEEFNRGESNLERFVREAKAASALNHPNILVIHEIGQSADAHYIVSEFIDGKTLRELIKEGAFQLSEVLEVSIQIANALTAAHTAHLVHRDIKPENIMMRPDGYVKVLDFGLAKLVEEKNKSFLGLENDTRRLHQTAKGVILGTVNYMSPEQAKGASVDERTDIFSLGVVIYEMIEGRTPFAGDSISETFANLINAEPQPLSRFAANVPGELTHIVSKMLRKNKDERYQTMKDVFTDLIDVRADLTSEEKLARLNSPDSNSATVVLRATTRDLNKQTTAARTTLSSEVPNRKPLFLTVGLLGGLLLVAACAWYVSRVIRKPGPTQPALTAVPLTTDPGYEGMPSLSPDGSQVAFGSFGEKLDNLDIYVKLIGGGPPIRLTSDPAVDKFPAWSPDGRSIAFIRERDNKQEVLLIPALGGSERKLTEIAPDLPAEISLNPPYLSWSPDSKYLVTVDRASPGEPPGLFVLSVTSGEKQRVITPPAPALADVNPAISPDGRALAFVRLISTGNTQLYVLPLSEDGRPTGEAQRLDLPQPWVESPVWTADGREIVCSAGPPQIGGMLWRVSVSNSEKPVYLASLGLGTFQPAVSRQGNRLVYSLRTQDSDIWRAEVSGRNRSRPAHKLIASTRWEINPQYSPDGSRIAFQSDRSGNLEIWVCNSDGSNSVQLTSLESAAGTPRWFPDGKRIVFDFQTEGQTEIYATNTDSRVPRRLTSDPSADSTPSVSHDGKWIYFASTRTGRSEVWRMPAEGGQALQVTQEGGFIPFESSDGKEVYYQKIQGDSDVWKVPVTGGVETRVLGPAGAFQFAVVTDGIYFIEPGSLKYAGWIKGNSLKFFSFAKGNAEKVFDIKYWPSDGLGVSPDGRYVLFSQTDPFLQDLMLVENFR